MPRESLAPYVEEFRHYKRDLAFVDRKGYRTVRWTYPRIAETAAQVARELERAGVQKGDRVLIWGEDCGEWVATFYGCVLRWLLHWTRSPPPNLLGGLPGRLKHAYRSDRVNS